MPENGVHIRREHSGRDTEWPPSPQGGSEHPGGAGTLLGYVRDGPQASRGEDGSLAEPFARTATTARHEARLRDTNGRGQTHRSARYAVGGVATIRGGH
jgi:hypothetical protein